MHKKGIEAANNALSSTKGKFSLLGIPYDDAEKRLRCTNLLFCCVKASENAPWAEFEMLVLVCFVCMGQDIDVRSSELCKSLTGTEGM